MISYDEDIEKISTSFFYLLRWNPRGILKNLNGFNDQVLFSHRSGEDVRKLSTYLIKISCIFDNWKKRTTRRCLITMCKAFVETTKVAVLLFFSDISYRYGLDFFENFQVAARCCLIVILLSLFLKKWYEKFIQSFYELNRWLRINNNKTLSR